MSDDPRSAGGLIVKEVAEVVPKADKQVAGRALGEALVNVGEIARDLTGILAGVAALPRQTGEFAIRLLGRWRKIPKHRRHAPPARLLLTAAAGYAATTDAELRACFERLAASAMDAETAGRVHPSFANSLAQMSGLEARFLKQIREGGSFHTYTELGVALGAMIDSTSLILVVQNLTRLAFIEAREPIKVAPFTMLGGWDREPAKRRWALHLYFEGDPQPFTRSQQAFIVNRERVVLGVSYYLTRLGTLFLRAVSDEADTNSG